MGRSESEEVSGTQREQRQEERLKGERGESTAREGELFLIISFPSELVT